MNQTSSARSTVCSANESSSSWWSVPKCSATNRASASSLPSPASANPTENVLTGSRHVPRHQPDDHARVEAAAQHRAERDVAHQPQPHRLVETCEQALAGFVEASSRPARAPGTTSTPRCATPRRSTISRWPGISLRTPRERRHRAGDEAERQVGVDRLVVELGARRARSRARSSARTRRRAGRRPRRSRAA